MHLVDNTLGLAPIMFYVTSSIVIMSIDFHRNKFSELSYTCHGRNSFELDVVVETIRNQCYSGAISTMFQQL